MATDISNSTAMITIDIQELRNTAQEERKSRQKLLEINRKRLLKELFLLTKDKQDVMPFLNQNQPEKEEVTPILTKDELIREQLFIENHLFKNGIFPPLTPAYSDKKQMKYLTTTLPRQSEFKHVVQMYNGQKLVDRRNDKPNNGLDLYAWQLKATSQPLYKQLQQARKVLTTHDWMLARDELKSIKTIASIEKLKQKNLWTSRQFKRQKTMPRTKTHWDLLMDEMKWMRTDFKEERKWKMANAYMLAKAVMEWHETEDKSSICIKTREPTLLTVGVIGGGGEGSEEEEEEEDGVAVEKDVMTEPTLDLITTNEIKDSDDDDDEEEEEENAMSLQVIEKYRTLIQILDPNESTQFTLLEQEDNIISLFPDLLLYTAPDADSIGNDPYFDESEYSRIIPFKLTTQRMKLKSVKKRVAKQLPTTTTILPPPTHISPLFAPKKPKDIPAIQPPQPQPPTTNSMRVIGTWSEEDDLCLIQLIVQYSFNWELICDALNATRGVGEKRTPWDCHERWRQNNLTSLSGQINSAYVSKLKKRPLPTSLKFDSVRKRQRQSNIFEAIKKTQKKREDTNKLKSNNAPPRSVIEIHGMSTQGQRLPSAMELSLHKIQRERQMAQALIEQRQLSNYGLNNNNSQQQPMRPSPSPQVNSSAVSTAIAVAAAAASVSASASASANNRGIHSPRPPPTPQQQFQQQQAAAVAQQQQQQQQVAAQQAQVQTQAQLQAQLQAQVQGVVQNGNTNNNQNRYPAAQLHLLRQQQMALMAAAQVQQQQQQQIRPPQPQPPVTTGPMQQRFQNVLNGTQGTVDNNNNNNNNTTTAVALAAQLAQLGYPLQSLQPTQQANLQRYIAQLQMRNQQQQQQLIPQQQQQLIPQQQQHLLQQQQMQQRLQAAQLQQQLQIQQQLQAVQLQQQQPGSPRIQRNNNNNQNNGQQHLG